MTKSYDFYCLSDISLKQILAGNSPDKHRQTRSVAYSVELVVPNKHQISGGLLPFGIPWYVQYYTNLTCFELHRKEVFSAPIKEMKNSSDSVELTLNMC